MLSGVGMGGVALAILPDGVTVSVVPALVTIGSSSVGVALGLMITVDVISVWLEVGVSDDGLGDRLTSSVGVKLGFFSSTLMKTTGVRVGISRSGSFVGVGENKTFVSVRVTVTIGSSRYP